MPNSRGKLNEYEKQPPSTDKLTDPTRPPVSSAFPKRDNNKTNKKCFGLSRVLGRNIRKGLNFLSVFLVFNERDGTT